MLRTKSAIDAGYIKHGHGMPGGTRRSRAARAGWFAGGAGLIGYGLTRRSAWGRLASILGGGAMIAAGALSRPNTPQKAGGKYGAMWSGVTERLRAADWNYVEASTVVNRPISEVYAAVHDLKNWPRIFEGVQEAHVAEDGSLTYAFQPEGGKTVWWRGRISEDYPEQLLSWESEPDNIYDEAGSLRFDKETVNSTRVTIAMSYRLPSGMSPMQAKAMMRWGSEEVASRDLQRLKEVAERMPQMAGAR